MPIQNKPLVCAGLALAAGLLARPASAQLEELEEGFTVGEWTFRPSVELRVRGEYRHSPVDSGGDIYGSDAVLADGQGSTAPPVVGRLPTVSDQWFVSERARLGLRVDWDVLSGVLVLQDARVLGILPGTDERVPRGGMGEFGLYQGYLGVRTKGDYGIDLRIGRQRVVWGDGRLLGGNDWTAMATALDAARLEVRLDEVDIEALGALLEAPGALPPEANDASGYEREGTGAQLYGLKLRWRVVPLFNFEALGLARVVREPVPSWLTPSDTFVADARVYGEYRGFDYSAEGAYQGGQIAAIGSVRTLSAFAVAAQAGLQTALPGDFRFGIFGGYASGQDASSAPDSTVTRFDPIMPEVHEQHGMMDLYAWSNNIEAGGYVGAKPFEEGDLRLGFAFAGLAEPSGRWVTGALRPVGAAPANESHVLGYEADLRFTITPWDPLSFGMGYGMFILGSGGQAVLAAAGRGEHDLLHFGYLQAELKVPR